MTRRRLIQSPVVTTELMKQICDQELKDLLDKQAIIDVFDKSLYSIVLYSQAAHPH